MAPSVADFKRINFFLIGKGFNFSSDFRWRTIKNVGRIQSPINLLQNDAQTLQNLVGFGDKNSKIIAGHFKKLPPTAQPQSNRPCLKEKVAAELKKISRQVSAKQKGKVEEKIDAVVDQLGVFSKLVCVKDVGRLAACVEFNKIKL